MADAQRPRSRLPLIVAAVLFVPAVVTGVFVGRSIPERGSPAITPAITTSAESGASHWRQQDRRDLATCQEKLAAQKTLPTVASTSVADASPGDAGRDATQVPTTVEGLETELRRCTKSELVVSAEVCKAAARQFEALMALPKDGQSCGPKSRAADLVEENFERCDVIAELYAAVRPDDLTKEQASVIAEAMQIHKTLTEEELLRRLKEFVYTCTDVTPERPPGLRKGPAKRPSGLRELPEREGVDL